jgi:hypothetical protein
MAAREVGPAAREPLHQDLQWIKGVEVGAVSLPAVTDEGCRV